MRHGVYKLSLLVCMTGYLVEGFLALQHAVDSELIDFIAANVSLNVPDVTMRLQRFPYPPYVHDSFVLVIQNQFPFIVLLSFIFFAMQIVRDLVYEKERRLKVLSLSLLFSGSGGRLSHCPYVVVALIAQQLFSYNQLSRLRKSATMAGLSHRSCKHCELRRMALTVDS